MTTVMDLRTGEFTTFSLSPKEAVVAAYAQAERKDWNTWGYENRYAGMVKVAPSARRGVLCITCGNQTCLTTDGALAIAAHKGENR